MTARITRAVRPLIGCVVLGAAAVLNLDLLWLALCVALVARSMTGLPERRNRV